MSRNRTGRITITKEVFIPRNITVAVSGGVDSMAVLDFLNRNHHVTAAHFNHGTAHALDAELLVTKFCKDRSIPLVKGHMGDAKKPPGRSPQDFFREHRYAFLDRFSETVITGHHLDDVVETWIFSSLRGQSKIIPHIRGNVLRPFLSTRKSDFEYWCVNHDVPWVEDPSNASTEYDRGYVRHELVPKALRINPGIHKTLRRKVEESVRPTSAGLGYTGVLDEPHPTDHC